MPLFQLVAICFSHQLVNKAFGGTVERTESNFVFGSDSVQFKDHILANEMLPCLPKAGTTWKLLESHRDEASLVLPTLQCPLNYHAPPFTVSLIYRCPPLIVPFWMS